MPVGPLRNETLITSVSDVMFSFSAVTTSASVEGSSFVFVSAHAANDTRIIITAIISARIFVFFIFTTPVCFIYFQGQANQEL